MENVPPEDPLGGDAARKQAQQDAANNSMEAFMMALQRYGAEQGRFAHIPSLFEDALLGQLKELTEQLAPLRQLSPPPEEPPDDVVKALFAIRFNLAHPDWNGAKRLDPGTQSTAHPFAVGAAAPSLTQSS